MAKSTKTAATSAQPPSAADELRNYHALALKVFDAARLLLVRADSVASSKRKRVDPDLVVLSLRDIEQLRAYLSAPISEERSGLLNQTSTVSVTPFPGRRLASSSWHDMLAQVLAIVASRFPMSWDHTNTPEEFFASFKSLPRIASWLNSDTRAFLLVEASNAARSLDWQSQPNNTTNTKTPRGEQQPLDSIGSWLKEGLPPFGWHKIPLCGLQKEILKWVGTTDKTLRKKNGVRWWVTPWIGTDDPKAETRYAIYFPTEAQYLTANQRRLTPASKNTKPTGENRRKSERTGAVRTKARRK